MSDLYVANSKGGAISDPKAVAQEIGSIVRDNRDFELAVLILIKESVFAKSMDCRRLGSQYDFERSIERLEAIYQEKAR